MLLRLSLMCQLEYFTSCDNNYSIEYLHFHPTQRLLLSMSNYGSLDCPDLLAMINFRIPRTTRSTELFVRKYYRTNYLKNGPMARLHSVGNCVPAELDLFCTNLKTLKKKWVSLYVDRGECVVVTTAAHLSICSSTNTEAAAQFVLKYCAQYVSGCDNNCSLKYLQFHKHRGCWSVCVQCVSYSISVVEKITAHLNICSSTNTEAAAQFVSSVSVTARSQGLFTCVSMLLNRSKKDKKSNGHRQDFNLSYLVRSSKVQHLRSCGNRLFLLG
ncbi:hypothetical protein J6590_011147 [Homalodisca vitripennis]|nr:hypothetical protein J6590_011147 [Homalodisca vitripennis]